MCVMVEWNFTGIEVVFSLFCFATCETYGLFSGGEHQQILIPANMMLRMHISRIVSVGGTQRKIYEL
jgi:hypothetical protein